MRENKDNKQQTVRQGGFTLLEVMVVIVILGILATMVVPNVMGNKAKADHQKVITDLTALENALQMYKLDNNRYPTTEQGLQALVEKPTMDPEPRHYQHNGYIRDVPRDPWGQEYLYMSPGEHSDVDIYTLGADGQVGGSDENQDIGNWNMHDQN